MLKLAVILFTIGAVCADMPTIFLDGDYSQESRIIKGEDANDGEFPYMVSLRKFGVTPGHFCGASILTSKWVLTAAHCCASIKNIPEFYAYVGSVYLSKGGSQHPIEKFIPHENYQQQNQWKNDICLIKLSKPIVFSEKVKQITLGPQNWPVNSKDKVTISGWGYTSPNGQGQKDIPDRLQKGVDFVAMSNEECARITNLKMFPGYLCARGGLPGQSTWNGDSGGPLVKQGTQVGLTSFGFRPYGNNMPTVYARTTNYVDWIKEKLGPDASQLKFAN